MSLVTSFRRGSGLMGRHMQRRSFSMWDRVHPSFWHPLATLEQSMAELDRATNHVLSAPFELTRSLLPRLHGEDDDFFHDFMSKERPTTKPKPKAKPASTGTSTMQTEDQENQAAAADEGPDEHAFSSYSYSSSTVVDSRGHEVCSVRRRYEDSTGRLKAVHLREIDGQRLKTLWRRHSADDPGEHKTVCSAGTPEEFEKRWRETPFGQAETHHDDKRLGQVASVEEAVKISETLQPGPDYDAASRAPDKQCDKAAEGVTPEAKAKSREEAIAEGSKNQAEETTPPQYG